MLRGISRGESMHLEESGLALIDNPLTLRGESP